MHVNGQIFGLLHERVIIYWFMNQRKTEKMMTTPCSHAKKKTLTTPHPTQRKHRETQISQQTRVKKKGKKG